MMNHLRAAPPIFQADLKKQGTRMKGWATRRCTVSDKALRYTHRFGGSQAILLTKETFIHLDDCDVRITSPGDHEPQVFRAPTRRVAMQLKAALLQEIGWQKKTDKADEEGQSAATSDVRTSDQQALEHARALKLCQAAAEGATELIHSIGVTREDVNSTITGSSPLHWACFEGKVDCVKQLLRLGASLSVEDRMGMVAAETCAFLGNRNKRKVLALLAHEQYAQRAASRLYAEWVCRVRQQHQGLTSEIMRRIIVDFGLGRRQVEFMRGRGNLVLQYPTLFAGPDGIPSRTDKALQAFTRVRQLQAEEIISDGTPSGDVPAQTAGIDSACFEQYSCNFPHGTLGMYFSGKDVDSDVKIDQLAADSVALQMGCQPGDLLISVCGTDCRGRGLQHAVDCVLRSQDLPERTFVFGRLRQDDEENGM